jgi:hypothetical protein
MVSLSSFSLDKQTAERILGQEESSLTDRSLTANSAADLLNSLSAKIASWQPPALPGTTLARPPIASLPVFYVLEIYQDTFRHRKPAVEIHTAEALSPISVGDYLYEASFPDPLIVPQGHILQVTAKEHLISTHARGQVTHITKVCVKRVSLQMGSFK